MQQVYQAASLLDAQLVQDALQDSGLEATINGAYLSGAIGELPADATPSVWVINAEDAGRARAVICELLDARASPADGDWICTCGERCEAAFQFCWRCGAAKGI